MNGDALSQWFFNHLGLLPWTHGGLLLAFLLAAGGFLLRHLSARRLQQLHAGLQAIVATTHAVLDHLDVAPAGALVDRVRELGQRGKTISPTMMRQWGSTVARETIEQQKGWKEGPEQLHPATDALVAHLQGEHGEQVQKLVEDLSLHSTATLDLLDRAERLREMVRAALGDWKRGVWGETPSPSSAPVKASLQAPTEAVVAAPPVPLDAAPAAPMPSEPAPSVAVTEPPPEPPKDA